MPLPQTKKPQIITKDILKKPEKNVKKRDNAESSSNTSSGAPPPGGSGLGPQD